MTVHLVTGVEMVREVIRPGADPVHTVMDMPVKEEDARAINEQAGGGKLSKEKFHEPAGQVVAKTREDEGACMKNVFPALANPAQNETLLAGGARRTPKANTAKMILGKTGGKATLTSTEDGSKNSRFQPNPAFCGPFFHSVFNVSALPDPSISPPHCPA